MKRVYSTRGALALQSGLNDAFAAGNAPASQMPEVSQATQGQAQRKPVLWLVVSGLILVAALVWFIFVTVKHKAVEEKHKIWPTLRNAAIVLLMVFVGVPFVKLAFINLRLAWGQSRFKALSWFANTVLSPVNRWIQLG
jgi:succinate dehydrogenase hydrophobic anchor subunit